MEFKEISVQSYNNSLIVYIKISERKMIKTNNNKLGGEKDLSVFEFGTIKYITVIMIETSLQHIHTFEII